MRYLLAFLVCCLTAAPLLGQDDLNLAQFYLTPAYLNPAFVGTTPHYRAVFHHRSQWNAIGATPNRQLASFEYNFITFDGGLGVQVLRTSFGGDLPWQSTAARLAYGQRIYLNRRWIIGGGLEVTYVNGGLDTDQLTFEDALLSGDPTQEINLPQERNSYLDLNAGLTIYNKAFYAGVALRNLTKPKRNAFGTTLNQLERALLLQAGYKTEILPEQYLAPALLFRYQNSFYQMDIGTNFDNQYFFGGLWYRGLPPLSGGVENATNQDALALTLGVRLGGLSSFAFSYEVNIGNYADAGNSFELSLVIAPKYNRTGRIGTHDILCPIGL